MKTNTDISWDDLGANKYGMSKKDVRPMTRPDDGRQVLMTGKGEVPLDGSRDPNDPNFLLKLALKNMGLSGATAKYGFVNVAASTTDQKFQDLAGNTLNAMPGQKYRVINYTMICGDTPTNVTFNSKGSGGGTAISMLHACAPNGGVAPAYAPVGHFETKLGEALTVTTGAGSSVGIQITYILV